MHRDTSWQTKVDGGYDQTEFSFDWDNMTATCPEGQTSIHWKDGKTASGKPTIHFNFSLPVCKACIARELCTRFREDWSTFDRSTSLQHLATAAAINLERLLVG
jgi:hypothetical protein